MIFKFRCPVCGLGHNVTTVNKLCAYGVPTCPAEGTRMTYVGYDESAHMGRVREFMVAAGQATPSGFKTPDGPTRELRARLILEEALETCQALGVDIRALPTVSLLVPSALKNGGIQIKDNGKCDIVGVADGCADLSVVNTGTMLAFGMQDEMILRIVDAANLRKFGPGGHKDASGKWIKPADFVGPEPELRQYLNS